jgi:RNase P subunit RPR2
MTRTEENAIVEADDCSHDHQYRLLSVFGGLLIGSFICGRVCSTLMRSNNMILNRQKVGKQQSLENRSSEDIQLVPEVAMAVMVDFPRPSQRCICDACNYNGTKYKITTYSVLKPHKTNDKNK